MNAFAHPPYTHDHPSLALSLSTRTRMFGTLNLAVAMRGKSCGWGTCARPRRTFIGRYKSSQRDHREAGRHFITLSVNRDAMMHTVWERTLWGDA